jgi:hypothetical protein
VTLVPKYRAGLRENETGVGKITAAGRKRSLIVPREHGAWGILLVPLVTGASSGLLAGGRPAGLVPLCLVALTLFWLRTPVESWIGIAAVRARTPGELRVVVRTVLGLAIAAGAGMVWLFWGGRNRALISIGCATSIAFLIQALVRRVWRGARTAAQMVGAAGLTSTAPAAYYVVTGRLDPVAWSLWAANLLFAVNQIQFVQMRIHAAHAPNRRQKLAIGRGFFAGQFLLIALIVAGCSGGIFRWTAAAAFLPVLARGFAWFAVEPKPLAIHALGKSELAYACVFGMLIIIGMHLP